MIWSLAQVKDPQVVTGIGRFRRLPDQFQVLPSSPGQVTRALAAWASLKSF